MSNALPPFMPPGPGPAGYATEQFRTGLAVTTLILGIVGLVMCPLAGIAAIVTGIVSLSQISREPHRYAGRGMAIGGLVCGGVSVVLLPFVFGLLMSIGLLLPPSPSLSLSRARELSERVACQSNMKGIHTTIRIYELEHEGQGWPTLDQLVASGDLAEEMLICPASGLEMSNYVLISPPPGQEDRKRPANPV